MTLHETVRVFHLTFYKCGSQWIRDVLTDPRIQEYAGYTLGASGVDAPSSPWPDPPPHTVSSPIYTVGLDLWRREAKPGDKAIVVLRDPRDIVVSMMYSIGLSHTASPLIGLLRGPIENASSEDRVRLSMFLLLQWSEYMRSWMGYKEHEMEYVTRYRHLVEDGPGELSRICTYLGWDVPEEVVREVAEAHSFSALTGRKAGEQNEFSHRRKGIAGDWKNHFNMALGRSFEEAFPGLLIDLEYETSTDWWKDLADRMPGSGEAPVSERQRLLRVLEEHQTELAQVRMAAEQRQENSLKLTAIITEQQRQLSRMEEYRIAADERLAALHALTEVVKEQKSRLEELDTYREAAQHRLEAVYALTALLEEQGRQWAEVPQLRQACRERLDAVHALTKTVETQEALLNELPVFRRAAAERLELIHELTERLAHVQEPIPAPELALSALAAAGASHAPRRALPLSEPEWGLSNTRAGEYQRAAEARLRQIEELHALLAERDRAYRNLIASRAWRWGARPLARLGNLFAGG